MREEELQFFSRFVRENESVIFSYIFRMIGNRADAEDLTSETFLRAFRTWDRVETGDADGYLRWCLRIAHNLTLDHCRKMRPQLAEESELEGISEDYAPSPEELYESTIRTEKIRECLLSLPEKYRAPLLLRFQNGLSYEQIAETLQISPPAVETQLHRARKMLRKKLKDLL